MATFGVPGPSGTPRDPFWEHGRKRDENVGSLPPPPQLGDHISRLFRPSNEKEETLGFFSDAGEAKKAVGGHVRSRGRFRSPQGPSKPGKCGQTTVVLFKNRGSSKPEKRAPGSTWGSILRAFGEPWGALGRLWVAPGLTFSLREEIFRAPKKNMKNRSLAAMQVVWGKHE